MLCITLPDVAIGVLIRECSHSKRVPLESVIVNITVLGFLGGTINTPHVYSMIVLYIIMVGVY